jgi:hypothetical protein
MPSKIQGGIHRQDCNRGREADEAVLWLELLIESGIIKSAMTVVLLKEAKELAAILTASRQTAKQSA